MAASIHESEKRLQEDPTALMRQARQLTQQQRAPEAIGVYESIVSRWPRFADAWYNLAILQRQQFMLDKALLSYERALEAGISRPEEVHVNRSVIYTNYLHEHEAAARELRKALTLNPTYVPALLNLATLHEDLGNRIEAKDLYEKILNADPRHSEALARFANLTAVSEIEPELLERLSKALGEGRLPAERASLGFALGRLLDALQRYHEAFEAYRDANKASRESAGPHVVPYDPKRQEAFVDLMIARGRPPVSADVISSKPSPVFILGMFRSGSTLVEQLLSSIPGVSAAGESGFIPSFVAREMSPLDSALLSMDKARFDSAATRYHGEIKRLFPSAQLVTDKRPDNFLYIGIIKSLFPDAKIVHTRRNPLDNCLSTYFLHIDPQMSYALDLLHIGHYYTEYRRLMDHWKREFPEDIVDVDYDALVREPAVHLGRLCAFLGLEWDGQVPNLALRSTAIKTASSWQAREPLYTSSSGRAKHYSSELSELEAFLADHLS